MGDLILHQYETSPFSEKIRLILGFKDLAWKAVEIPSIMPKPDLIPLTGGYRRTPVLQIGADIYCDTQIIVRELERRYPSPSLYPDGAAGLDHAAMMWTDRPFFQGVVGVIFGALPEIDPAFVEDREKMTGQQGAFKQLMAMGPHFREQLRAHLALAESQFTDGRLFLTGDTPRLADFNLYHVMWFLSRNIPNAESAVFGASPHTSVWIERMAGFGHGARTDINGSDALDIAASREPDAGLGADPAEPNGLATGQHVAVMPEDYGRDPVAGELVTSSPHEIAIRRADDRVGSVVVHFPRIGFVVQAL